MKRLMILAALVTGPVYADGNINGVAVDCYCTDTQGARVEIGQSICLFVDGKAFMALCDMSLNVPIWRRQAEGCLSSLNVDVDALRLQSLDPGIYPRGVHTQIIDPKS